VIRRRGFSFFFFFFFFTQDYSHECLEFGLSAHVPFDNIGSPYIARNIITNGLFDPVKYLYDIFISTTLGLTWATVKAVAPAIFVHMFCKFESLLL